MKFKSIFILLLVISLSFSCKNEEKKAADEQEEVSQRPFTVGIKMNVKEDDVICLYYKDNTISFFTEDMAVYKNLKKGDGQDILFELPEGAVPNDFRFDLSCQNKNQVCHVESIHFLYKGKSFEIFNKDLEKYLKPNEGVVFDNQKRDYSFKDFNGNYDPFLTTTLEFYPLLETLVGYDAFKPIVK
jgi:hypothetical protein